MRVLRYLFVVFVLVAGWRQAEAQPRPAPPTPVAQPAPPDNRQRWERLSPEERQGLRQRYERWQDLSESQRQELSDRYRQLEALAPAERAALRDRFEAWRQLSPEERARMQRRLEHWRRLSPAEKEPVVRALWVLKHLLPEEFESFKHASGAEREKLRQTLARRLAALLSHPMAELRRLGELPPEARRKAVESLLAEPPKEGVPLRQRSGATRERGAGYSAGK